MHCKRVTSTSLVFSCDQDSRFIDWRSKGLLSLFGEIELSRPYYYCSSCHTGHLPWDVQLGLTSRRVTPAVAELVTLAGTLGSFELAAERVLEQISRVRLAESTVQRVHRRRRPTAGKETSPPRDFRSAGTLGLAA